MIVQTCDLKTRFPEIIDWKEENKCYFDWRSLECLKQGLNKHVYKKVKFENDGG